MKTQINERVNEQTVIHYWREIQETWISLIDLLLTRYTSWKSHLNVVGLTFIISEMQDSVRLGNFLTYLYLSQNILFLT